MITEFKLLIALTRDSTTCRPSEVSSVLVKTARPADAPPLEEITESKLKIALFNDPITCRSSEDSTMKESSASVDSARSAQLSFVEPSHGVETIDGTR